MAVEFTHESYTVYYHMYSIHIYAITWLLCAFSLVVDYDLFRDLLKNTHRWRQIHAISRQRTCFSFFMPPNPSINYLDFYCINQIDNIFSVRACTVIDHRRPVTACVKNNSHATRLRLVSYFFVLYTLWRHLWSITVHTRKNIYLLNIFDVSI